VGLLLRERPVNWRHR